MMSRQRAWTLAALLSFVRELVVKDIAILYFIVLFCNTFDNNSLIKLFVVACGSKFATNL
jgi:hypothetical protein